MSAFFNNTAENSWDSNIADPPPVLRMPEGENRADLDALVSRRAETGAKYDALGRSAGERFEKWRENGNTASAVDADGLKLRLRLDEGKGQKVRNSAPEAATREYSAETNPIVWNESVWLWPAIRLDLAGKLSLPDQGDFEADEPFSAALWTRLRQKAGGANSGNGSLLARMGGRDDDAHRGWDVFIDGDKLVIHLVHEWPRYAIRVETTGVPRGERIHLGFSYDGTRSGDAIKLYINGRSCPKPGSHGRTSGQRPG